MNAVEQLKNELMNGHSEYRRRWNFANGYGASVIRNQFSYGVEDGLYELAVFKGEHLCYDTEITSDVEGYLTPREVVVLLKRISQLEGDTK